MGGGARARARARAAHCPPRPKTNRRKTFVKKLLSAGAGRPAWWQVCSWETLSRSKLPPRRDAATASCCSCCRKAAAALRLRLQKSCCGRWAAAAGAGAASPGLTALLHLQPTSGQRFALMLVGRPSLVISKLEHTWAKNQLKMPNIVLDLRRNCFIRNIWQ